MTGEAFDCDVLVVGLGPVGAALAALLAAQGVQVIAIDRNVDVYPMPRAVHFDHEIMRLLQQIGVAPDVLRGAREVPDYEFRASNGRLLMKIPPAAQTPSGWAAGYMFHQPSLEDALRAVLDRSGQADVRLGRRFTQLTQDAEGVCATIHGDDGPASLRARYLIGCDGASSQVRDAIGGKLSDYGFDEPWLVLDVRHGPGARLPAVNLQICDPARPTTCVLGGPGRHRWEFMLLPGETPEAMVKDETIWSLLAPWDCGPVEIERKAVYRFHGLVADQWRFGRVLLAGDAAHQTPPFAGQGMCAGLRDAANLSWKLAEVLAGRADDALLDTYQVEREPNARAYIELAIAMGRIVCTLDPEVAAARDAEMVSRLSSGGPPIPPRQPPPFAAGCIMTGAPGAGAPFPQPCVEQGGATIRLDDSLGLGPWLIVRNSTGLASEGVRIVDLKDEAAAPFQPALEAWLERHHAAAVLVRPDRCVFGVGDPAELLHAWAEALSPSPRRTAPARSQ